MTGSAVFAPRHRERLRVPARWWVLLALLVVTVWVVLLVATPPVVLWPATALFAALGGALLLGYGRARVEVGAGGLRAGRAWLEWAHCGEARALDPAATRRACGVDADARAFLVIRPYIRTAVRVDVDDPADPTPYWIVSSRRPDTLAAAINTARAMAD